MWDQALQARVILEGLAQQIHLPHLILLVCRLVITLWCNPCTFAGVADETITGVYVGLNVGVFVKIPAD